MELGDGGPVLQALLQTLDPLFGVLLLRVLESLQVVPRLAFHLLIGDVEWVVQAVRIVGDVGGKQGVELGARDVVVHFVQEL